MSTPTSIEALLHEHIGHRTTLVEQPGRLLVKCLSCAGILLDLSTALGLRPGPAKPTTAPASKTRDLPRLNDPNACPTHPGQWRDNCSPCRSEQLEGDTPTPPAKDLRQGVDPNDVAEYVAARELLRQREADRKLAQAQAASLNTTELAEPQRTISSKEAAP